ncbi:MAG: sulfite exporter TauE/SafE family protein [Pseudomonadales bacterium]|nr:sulfite exporter TauE/SafE family protein [Pseudomonadales bacterium]
MDHLFFITICVAVGAVTGFLGGLLGIGGGVIVVPALIILFDAVDLFPSDQFPANTATLLALGTSLSTIIFTSASAAYAQIRRGMVEWLVVRRWIVFLSLGSLGSSYVASSLSDLFLKTFIAAFVLFVACVMLTSWKPNPSRALPGRFLSAALGSIGGLIAGIAGIGGANIMVPTLIYFNAPILRATATASAVGPAIALFGTVGYISSGLNTEIPNALGFVYLPATVSIIASSVLIAPIGVRTAHKISSDPLRKAFGILMIFVALRILWSTYY